MTDPSDCYRALAGDVYHIHLNCPVGRLIPDEWRRSGSGGLPLCPACRAREAAARRLDPPPPADADGRMSPREDGSS
jgi:hypothetical protein